MEYFIKKKIGRETHTFVVTGENLHDLVMESQKLSFGDVHNCGLCESDLLVLNARVAQKKFKYVDIKCLKCKGSLTFGNTQEDSDVYYLRKEATADKNGHKEYAWKPYAPTVNE